MEELKAQNSGISGKKTTSVQMPQAKIPPQSIDLEKSVIGAMLVDKRGVDEVIDILEAEHFYLKEHQEIYSVITELFQNGQPIDILTVSDSLRTRGTLKQIGGEYYLVSLSNIVATAANIEYYARVILQMYVKRRLIEIAGEIAEQAFDDETDVLNLLDETEKKIFEVSQGSLKKGTSGIDSLISDVKKQLEDLSGQEGLSGIPTGFPVLDEYTSGWQNGDLIIIAARPGMGKTAFVLTMARNISIDHRKPVALFNLEMTSSQLVKRLISIETEIPSEVLRNGKLSDKEWSLLHNSMDKMQSAPVYINDSSMLSIFDIRAQARRMKSQYDIGLLVIDYLQLVNAQTGGKQNFNREQEISTISRNLKSLAKELDIPVIALSQLSRKVEERSDKSGHKRPQLSDLRESGAIEQDADIVSFIYRPEYYKIETWEDDTPTENQAEFIIAKHRNGKTGEIRLKFEGHIGRFSDLSISNEFTFESSLNSDITADDFLPPENDTDEDSSPLPF